MAAFVAPFMVQLAPSAFVLTPRMPMDKLSVQVPVTGSMGQTPSLRATKGSGKGESSSWSSSAPACSVLLAAFAGAALAVSDRRRRFSRDGGGVARRGKIATSPHEAIPWWQRMLKVKTETGVGIWAEKLNTTQIFESTDAAGPGKVTNCTILVVKRGGNIVTNKKWPERHGYYAVEVSYDRYIPEDWERETGGRRTRLKHLENLDLPYLKKAKEFRVRPQDFEKWEIGQKVVVSEQFKEGDKVQILGRSQSKGFQGPCKLWNHVRGPMTHGSKHHKRYGSLGSSADQGRVLPGKKLGGWQGDKTVVDKGRKIMKIIDNIDEDNMPETIIVVKGSVTGYSARKDQGGSYVRMHHVNNRDDGRFKRDPVWMWFTKKEEGTDPYVPLKNQAWTWKTYWGRDLRWIAGETKKYWPDGFPGYDHSADPFYDDCDPRKALKAPEW